MFNFKKISQELDEYESKLNKYKDNFSKILSNVFISLTNCSNEEAESRMDLFLMITGASYVENIFIYSYALNYIPNSDKNKKLSIMSALDFFKLLADEVNSYFNENKISKSVGMSEILDKLVYESIKIFNT